jgi:hypothetical protein
MRSYCQYARQPHTALGMKSTSEKGLQPGAASAAAAPVAAADARRTLGTAAAALQEDSAGRNPTIEVTILRILTGCRATWVAAECRCAQWLDQRVHRMLRAKHCLAVVLTPSACAMQMSVWCFWGVLCGQDVIGAKREESSCGCSADTRAQSFTLCSMYFAHCLLTYTGSPSGTDERVIAAPADRGDVGGGQPQRHPAHWAQALHERRCGPAGHGRCIGWHQDGANPGVEKGAVMDGQTKERLGRRSAGLPLGPASATASRQPTRAAAHVPAAVPVKEPGCPMQQQQQQQ